MITSYGLDLAGFSTGKSVLAKATYDEAKGFCVIVYRNNPFSRRFDGDDPIVDQLNEEKELLLSLRPIYIDVPIDLQGLPTPNNYYFTWELTKRPVDFVLGGLPPLADRIGTLVARMQILLRLLRNDGHDLLGSQLFETYPQASLDRMLGIVPRYKGKKAKFSNNLWIAVPESPEEFGLAEILNSLEVKANDGTVLNDDHFDAMLCSLTGVVGGNFLLQGADLENLIRKELNEKIAQNDQNQYVVPIDKNSPRGYVIIKDRPELLDRLIPIFVTLEDNYPG